MNMKKYSVMIGMGILLCGCSSASSSGVMTCTSINQNEATEATVTMELSYEKDMVLSQKANTKVIAKTDEIYEQVKTIAANSEIAYQQIAGTTYTHTVDDEARALEEYVTLDFASISAEDLQKVVSYRQVEDLNIHDIQTSLEEQGFTCSMK